MRTKSFVFTADVNSVFDMMQIETLRSSIKSVNAMAKESDRINDYRYNTGYDDMLPAVTPKYRVSLMPRGPRRAAAIADGVSKYSYDSCLPIRHAETIDVYIHERR
jgi:hypothetical protein